MKRRLFFLLFAVLSVLPTLAESFTVDGIRYYTTSTNTCSVRYNDSYYSGDVVIPESVTYNGTEYSVTGIGYGAFEGCSGLTSITIPNSVTEIGNSAFRDCSSLTSVTIGNSVTKIDSSAFKGCNGLTSVEIGNSVTSIGKSAFEGCSGLTSVEIGNSVTSIGESAFEGCSSLTSVTIPNSVMEIDENTFYGCSSLTSVEIPNSVTSIGRSAFEYCCGLTSVSIGNSVTTIGSNAFKDCYDLKKVYISDLAAWCNIQFGDNYSNPLSLAHHLFLNGEEIKDLIIPNSVTRISDRAFSGCSGLTSVTIPNSVTEIGNEAFRDCSGLTSLTIKDGGTILDLSSDSFDGCSIETLYLGRNISPSQYFAGRSALTSLTFGNLINSIDKGAFKNCSGLTSVVLPMGLTSVNESVFENCSALASVTIPGGVRYIRSGAFKGCSSLESVNMINPIPAVIEEDSFDFQGTLNVPAESKMYYWIHPLWSKFPELEAWNVGSDVDFAENSVTYHITSEESATVEITAATLMARAAGELTVPETVEFNGKTYTVAGVANDAFRDMNFATIELPQTIAYVGLNAFSGCKSLNSLTVNAQMPPSVARESFDDGVYGSTTLIIPEDSREDYENHEIWGLFAKKDIVGIEGVDSLPSADAEIEVYNLKGVKVGESLEGLAKGVYIVRQGGKSTKVAI